MKTKPSNSVESASVDDGGKKGLAGAQTLARGLEVMMVVAAGKTDIADIAQALELTRSTAYRLAMTLVEHRFLTYTPRIGYALGSRILELGHVARRQTSLLRVAQEHLAALAASSGDTVHLGIRDGARALYLEKIAGSRRVDISSRVGERQPLRSTGLGKALLLDEDESGWGELYDYEAREGGRYGVERDAWLGRMRQYALKGYAFDLEENEDRIRCVAAPVRDASGKIVGALSVSSAAQYMDDERMVRLADEVLGATRAISRDLGWSPDKHGA